MRDEGRVEVGRTEEHRACSRLVGRREALLRVAAIRERGAGGDERNKEADAEGSTHSTRRTRAHGSYARF
jgi:hypothetical protein